MLKKIIYPSVSIVMPTLNSQRVLNLSLASISNQKYKGKLEIIIADGGSIDQTLKIARKYKVRIIKNKLKTGESGKAIGVKYAVGDILALIDSDNILPDDLWLENMVKPFIDDQEIIATEPLYFNHRESDFWLTRYFALIGMGDPLNLFIGNYDRYNFISNKWTELNIPTKNKENYLSLYLTKDIPTIGANGFLIKKNELKKYPIRDYLFDIDILKYLIKEKPIKIAKVKIGIIHLFSGNISTFVRKQRRRIRDYLYFQGSGVRVDELNKILIGKGIIKFVLGTIFIFPICFQAIKGYKRKKDIAWFFHPIACWITFWVYGSETIISIFKKGEFDRKKWSQ